MSTPNFNWDAAAFFERLTATNRLARDNGFTFGRVASLDDFLSLISETFDMKACVAVSDISSGALDLNNSPHTRRVKAVFLFMRHEVGDAVARKQCLDLMNELFRQFMTVLLLEKTRLAENCLYIDNRISFTEVEKYFYTGGACAYFQIAVSNFTNLIFNPEEWIEETP